jgi:hypothetical protein
MGDNAISGLELDGFIPSRYGKELLVVRRPRSFHSFTVFV